jgi:hypothetical protein
MSDIERRAKKKMMKNKQNPKVKEHEAAMKKAGRVLPSKTEA